MNKEELNVDLLESIFRTSKKTIVEYTREIERGNRYKSTRKYARDGAILDDRSRLIDLYESCLEQDAHIKSVIETLTSQIIGDRYMLATINDKGKYVKNVKYTEQIQNSQFDKIIQSIVESKLYGYSLIEIFPSLDINKNKTIEVNVVERRNTLPDQNVVVMRQGDWSTHWDITTDQYKTNYILINSGGSGLFSATTPLILAKKFTMANYVNFSHTYGQPIIHGKTVSENSSDRRRLANEIANAAQQKVLVTGMEDSIDIKTFTMSNSEKIYTSLINHINKEVSNLILGSESMAGATQSYVGSTEAHQDIFRDRIKIYRRYIENIMNEEVIPRLQTIGYIPKGLKFKYSNHNEMDNGNKIKLYNFLTDKYEITADEIEKEFGVNVGKQFNVEQNTCGSSVGDGTDPNNDGPRVMSDEEYYKRYGKTRNSKQSLVNHLKSLK